MPLPFHKWSLHRADWILDTYNIQEEIYMRSFVNIKSLWKSIYRNLWTEKQTSHMINISRYKLNLLSLFIVQINAVICSSSCFVFLWFLYCKKFSAGLKLLEGKGSSSGLGALQKFPLVFKTFSWMCPLQDKYGRPTYKWCTRGWFHKELNWS